jgi:hypothetical protein
MVQENEGKYVLYSEYAALKVELAQQSNNNASLAIALLNEKLSFYDTLKPVHDAVDEYHDIMKRWRSATANIA